VHADSACVLRVYKGEKNHKKKHDGADFHSRYRFSSHAFAFAQVFFAILIRGDKLDSPQVDDAAELPSHWIKFRVITKNVLATLPG